MVKNPLSIVQAIFKILGEKLTSNRKEARFTLFTIVQVPARYNLSSLK